MSLILADILVVVHLLFVGFVMAGGFLLSRWPRLAWIHLPAAAWGAFIEFSGGICPLTPLENRLRAQGGGSGPERGQGAAGRVRRRTRTGSPCRELPRPGAAGASPARG